MNATEHNKLRYEEQGKIDGLSAHIREPVSYLNKLGLFLCPSGPPMQVDILVDDMRYTAETYPKSCGGYMSKDFFVSEGCAGSWSTSLVTANLRTCSAICIANLENNTVYLAHVNSYVVVKKLADSIGKFVGETDYERLTFAFYYGCHHVPEEVEGVCIESVSMEIIFRAVAVVFHNKSLPLHNNIKRLIVCSSPVVVGINSIGDEIVYPHPIGNVRELRNLADAGK